MKVWVAAAAGILLPLLLASCGSDEDLRDQQSALEAQVADLRAQNATLEQQITQLQASLGMVEEEVYLKDSGGDIDRSRSQIAVLNRDVLTLQGDVSGLQKTVSKLEDEVYGEKDSRGLRLGGVAADVFKLKTDVYGPVGKGGLAADVSTLKLDVSRLLGNVSNLQTEVLGGAVAIPGMSAGLKGDVSELTWEMASLKESISELRNEVYGALGSSLNSRIDRLER